MRILTGALATIVTVLSFQAHAGRTADWIENNMIPKETYQIAYRYMNLGYIAQINIADRPHNNSIYSNEVRNIYSGSIITQWNPVLAEVDQGVVSSIRGEPRFRIEHTGKNPKQNLDLQRGYIAFPAALENQVENIILDSICRSMAKPGITGDAPKYFVTFPKMQAATLEPVDAGTLYQDQMYFYHNGNESRVVERKNDGILSRLFNEKVEESYVMIPEQGVQLKFWDAEGLDAVNSGEILIKRIQQLTCTK